MTDKIKNKLWQKAIQIYEKSLQLKETDRQSFILEQTDSNQELYRIVKQMLQADKAASFLDNKPAFYIDENVDAMDGATFGQYKILKKIAVGGMGRIYQAKKTDADVDILMALKLIRRELLNDDLAKRFDNEKQILAQLKHHHIATLIDAGVIAQTAFIATEWIEGQSIDSYVEQNNSTLDEILQLFIQTCEAVAHAHNKLIIHRDIKPSNILIDKNHQVKLLDFGIAKLVDADSGSYTQTQIYTPDYAAPEQVNGNICTATTDIYALGVLLFELLTGQKRFALDNLSVAEKIEKIIAPVSQMASRTMAKNNQPQSSKVKGALDTIINQAMHPDPNRRYASVHGLISDIKNFQNNRPISAMGDGLGYRMTMFIKRNSWSSLFAGLLLFSLIGGLLLTISQKKEAEIAQMQAQSEAEKSQHLLDFFKNMLEAATPNHGGSTQITVEEMVNKGGNSFNLDGIEDPKLKAEVAWHIANFATVISAHELNLKYNSEALSFYEKSIPQYTFEYLSIHISMAYSYRDHNEYQKGLDTLESAYNQAKPYGLIPSVEAQTLINLSEFYRGLHDNEQALTLLEQAETVIKGKNDPKENLHMAEIRFYQHLILKNQLTPIESEKLLTEAQSYFAAAYSHAHPSFLSVKNSLGLVYKSIGKYQQSIALFDELHVANTEMYGRKSHEYLINQADSYFHIGQPQKTISLINEAFRVMEEEQIATGFTTMAANVILSRAYLDTGGFSESERLLSEAIAYFEARLDPNHILMHTLKTYWLNLLIGTNQIGQLDFDVSLLLNDMKSKLNDSNTVKQRYINTVMVSGLYYWRSERKQKALNLMTEASDMLSPLSLKQEWSYWLIEAAREQLNLELNQNHNSEVLDEALKQLNILFPPEHWYHDFFKKK